jgi:hypothetical protein
MTSSIKNLKRQKQKLVDQKVEKVESIKLKKCREKFGMGSKPRSEWVFYSPANIVSPARRSLVFGLSSSEAWSQEDG